MLCWSWVTYGLTPELPATLTSCCCLDSVGVVHPQTLPLAVILQSALQRPHKPTLTALGSPPENSSSQEWVLCHPNPSSLPEFTPPLSGLTRSALALHFQYLMFLFKICFSRQRKSGDSCCLLPAILIPVSGRGGHTINASLINRCMHAWHAYLNI